MKKVAVVGAGLSGLVTIKELLEAGCDVVCYERRREEGGVFSSQASYDSVLLTVSNKFMAYSDFVPSEEELKFWDRAQYRAYLRQYALSFGLIEHIKFGCQIEQVMFDELKPTLSYVGADGERSSASFDHVVICSGQFQQPKVPAIPGLEGFSGAVVHSSQYTCCDDFPELSGKSILFVGMGESAADVVTELYQRAHCGVLSVRRPHVFAPRKMGNDMPIDVHQSRFWHALPAAIKAQWVRNQWRDQLNSGQVDPATKLMAEHILCAADEPGSVVTKAERVFEAIGQGLQLDIGGIDSIDGSSVRFNSGRVGEFDAIVFCTGYEIDLPFLAPEYRFRDSRDLYLTAFHPKLQDKLVFSGFCRPQQGGVPLMAEMLARYIAQVFIGRKCLPSDIQKVIASDRKGVLREFYETPEVPGLVNGLRFNERLAKELGCKPPVPSRLFRPRAYYAYWNFHILPQQYRQVGPEARCSASRDWLTAQDGAARRVGDIGLLECYRFIAKLLKMRIKALLATKPEYKWRPF